ncbi:MAG: hypothetical protein BTN85_0963 [Candidatus Methanohalarchaeum thermophilum]|uniref:DUF211 domain-containing protein n=1 Tax=Methanohalarchaeum thermophilum TaxID=1903181 RepID=A0A1Q6DVY9_METT1|nr:MAG: hypothetical protein BTN85_0963 [Candidatus Methanohalarchaeum thermophilum]
MVRGDKIKVVKGYFIIVICLLGDRFMSGVIKRIVLDVLKPHQPSLLDLAENISSTKGVEGVNLSLYEVDQQTENIKVTIEGKNIDYNEVKRIIEDVGAVIHSIDEVAAGNQLVEEVETLQDR